MSFHFLRVGSSSVIKSNPILANTIIKSEVAG